MHSHIDLTDPYTTAAAAIAASLQAAVHLRQDLPALLGERSAGYYGILAERLEDGGMGSRR